ncbi:MAG: hypothetical protein V1775_06915 [Bacteroidota bacterium]
MKRSIVRLLLSILIFSTLAGCETDFDVTAPWKDITVVYGLISQNDSVHYVRVNKAFLGDGNAYTYAQIADSSSYGDNIEVTIYEILGNDTLRTFLCEKTMVTDKESGIFSTTQEAYKAEFKMPSDVNQSNRDYLYTVKIRNIITGKSVTGSTKVVKSFVVTKPREDQSLINFVTSSSQKVQWTSAVGGRRYNISVRFWFEEVWKGNKTLQRYIDWQLSSVKSESDEGNDALEIFYSPLSFYVVCKNLIPYSLSAQEDSVVSRMVDKAEFRFMVAADELNTYMEVNEPSTGIVQDKPEYTNIENGYGLFSSRYTKSIAIPIGDPTEELLFEENLKFIDNPDNK